MGGGRTAVLDVEREDFVRGARGAVGPDEVDEVPGEGDELGLLWLEGLPDGVGVGCVGLLITRPFSWMYALDNCSQADRRVGSTPMRVFWLRFYGFRSQ